MRFLLEDVHHVEQLTTLTGFSEITPDLLMSVLEQGAHLCEDVLAPLNQSGDAEGCHLENGKVRTPKGFKAAYDAFRAGGWTTMTSPEEFGGQGLPHLARTVFDEMLC